MCKTCSKVRSYINTALAGRSAPRYLAGSLPSAYRSEPAIATMQGAMDDLTDAALAHRKAIRALTDPPQTD